MENRMIPAHRRYSKMKKAIHLLARWLSLSLTHLLACSLILSANSHSTSKTENRKHQIQTNRMQIVNIQMKFTSNQIHTCAKCESVCWFEYLGIVYVTRRAHILCQFCKKKRPNKYMTLAMVTVVNFDIQLGAAHAISMNLS